LGVNKSTTDAQIEIPPAVNSLTKHGERVTEGGMRHSDGSLRTARLLIRRFTKDDWVSIQALAKDKESSDGAVYDHTWPTSDEGCKGMAGYLSGKESFWAVCLKDDGSVIGLLSFNDVDEKARLDLGHMFHTEYRRDRL